MSYPPPKKAKTGPKVFTGNSHRGDFAVNEGSMLSERVRFLRLCMGLTMEQLAQKAGVCRPTIDSIESGRGLGRIDVLRKVSNALDCKLRINLTPNRQMRLDHRVLRRDGRIARQPRVKTREEGYRLDELLAHLNPKVAARPKHRRRYTGPSEMAVKRLRQMREAVAAKKDEPPSQPPPST